jgi:hypothetical protein
MVEAKCQDVVQGLAIEVELGYFRRLPTKCASFPLPVRRPNQFIARRQGPIDPGWMISSIVDKNNDVRDHQPTSNLHRMAPTSRGLGEATEHHPLHASQPGRTSTPSRTAGGSRIIPVAATHQREGNIAPQ